MQLVPASNFGMNWDIGNGYWQGETSFPDGYVLLPKKRIWHMHLKDVRCAPNYKDCNTAIVGTGQVKLTEQIRALVRDGYDGTMSLEPEYEDQTNSHLAATQRSLEALLKIMAAALEIRIPDAAAAIKVAEPALIRVSGKKNIEDEKPLTATLEGGVWHVYGTLCCSDGKGQRTCEEGRCVGGVAHAQVRQRDGKVLSITHGK